MTPEIIEIDEKQLTKITAHGIHFLNEEHDEDFIAFMQCYEGFAHFVVSDHAQEQLALEKKSAYEAFLEKYRRVKALAVYDDITHDKFIGLIIFNNTATVYTVYNLQFSTDAIYQQTIQRIQQFGWYMFATSELESFEL